MEPHQDAHARGSLRTSALRGTRGASTTSNGGHVRGPVPDVRGAGPAREPTGPLFARARGGPRGAGRNPDGAFPGDGGGYPGHDEGRRRLFAPRPGLSCRAAGFYVAGCARTRVTDPVQARTGDSGLDAAGDARQPVIWRGRSGIADRGVGASAYCAPGRGLAIDRAPWSRRQERAAPQHIGDARQSCLCDLYVGFHGAAQRHYAVPPRAEQPGRGAAAGVRYPAVKPRASILVAEL